ncbi:MAG: type II secretion system GspH family protein [Gemmataceae bacterium]|nr:type II secretion system GspH family protein [Gemmataceae bacterium]MDW8264165.1 type II secretion system protein [Gemmataceae bacterium]
MHAVQRRRAAFTLVELMVVIAIIVTLLGLSVPAVFKVNQLYLRVHCMSNLADLGQAIDTYLRYSGGRYPDAAQMPSVTPNRPSLQAVLSDRRHQCLDPNSPSLKCPADQKRFPVEGISYEYKAGGRRGLAGRLRDEVSAPSRRTGRPAPLATILVLYDFDEVHAAAGSAHSRCYLYADYHVE